MDRPDIAHVRRWLAGERPYVEGKFGVDGSGERVAEENPGHWIAMYIDRGVLLGLDTPQGRQAVAKAMSTMVAWTEYVVRHYGPLPDPGHSSGEIRPFRTPTTELLEHGTP